MGLQMEQPRSPQRARRIGILVLLLILLVLIALIWLRPFLAPPVPVPAPAETNLSTATPTIASPTVTPTVSVAESSEAAPTPEPTTEPFLACLDNECRHELALPDPPGTLLEIIDDSSEFNWSIPTDACLADIAAFMTNEGIEMARISFTLQNALQGTGTPVFYQFPPSVDPLNAPSPNEGTAMCSLDTPSETSAYCEVAVSRIDEEGNDNVRLALVLAAMDALRRVHYEQVTENLEAYYLALEEELDRFVPVIREENGVWTTNCWELFP